MDAHHYIDTFQDKIGSVKEDWYWGDKNRIRGKELLKGSARKELSRFEVLLSQFQAEDFYIDYQRQQSLNRIFSFLYECTNVYYLVFLRSETLYEYLKYHYSNQFKIISFCQAVKDIKTFLQFLENKKEIKKAINIDLSLQNTGLWVDM